MRFLRAHILRVAPELALALVVGVACGLLDAAALKVNLFSARGGINWIPARTWIALPLL